MTSGAGAISIRRASEGDVAIVLTFIRELAAYERLSHEAVVSEERLRATLFGAEPAAEVLLADMDGASVGFALFFHNYSTFLGCGRLEWSVLDWNEPAIAFYRGLGAEPMSEWTVFRLTGSRLDALADPLRRGAASRPGKGA